MNKNITIFFFLTMIVAIGIGYIIYSDPERPSIDLFNRAMSEFAKNATELEVQFKENSSLLSSSKNLSLAGSSTGTTARQNINMLVSNHFVTLIFSDGDWPLANQSIILEPFIPESSSEDQQIRWKCIAGSVLVRFRSKDCRLGYGVLISDLD